MEINQQQTGQNQSQPATQSEGQQVSTEQPVHDIGQAQTGQSLLGNDANQSEAKPDDESVKAEKVSETIGAPDSYEFKAPEGFELDKSVSDAFASVAKELDISQGAASKILDKMIPAMHDRSISLISKTTEDWKTQVMSDPEIGGEAFQENLSVAKKALDRYGSPELNSLLAGGLGSHPEIIRLLYKVGKSISEDTFVNPSRGKESEKPKPLTLSGVAAGLFS